MNNKNSKCKKCLFNIINNYPDWCCDDCIKNSQYKPNKGIAQPTPRVAVVVYNEDGTTETFERGYK